MAGGRNRGRGGHLSGPGCGRSSSKERVRSVPYQPARRAARRPPRSPGCAVLPSPAALGFSLGMAGDRSGSGGRSLGELLPARFFQRVDESEDGAFYAAPRFVNHIDDTTIAALTSAYRDLVPAGSRVLDLMSSWVSHLPADVAYARVVGQGMSEAELARNPRLDETLVRDLNRDPELPWPDASFDAALCAVSVQYLTRPLEVFRSVRRVLTPGALYAVAISHRMFPTKA